MLVKQYNYCFLSRYLTARVVNTSYVNINSRFCFKLLSLSCPHDSGLLLEFVGHGGYIRWRTAFFLVIQACSRLHCTGSKRVPHSGETPEVLYYCNYLAFSGRIRTFVMKEKHLKMEYVNFWAEDAHVSVRSTRWRAMNYVGPTDLSVTMHYGRERTGVDIGLTCWGDSLRDYNSSNNQ